MIAFIVPVKSKQVSLDWSKFCQLFERTLKSICNQTDKNFKVVVVCHEIPEIQFTHKNIHFIKADFEPHTLNKSNPEGFLLKRRLDKGNKLKLGVAFAQQEFKPDYVMTVDSDDFISNRIAAYVNNNSEDVPGWYIKNGYLHFNWKKFLVLTRKFNDLCGSSIIVKPELLVYFFDKRKIDIYFDHRLKVLGSDYMLSKLPFNGGIYHIANGENLYMSFHNVKTFNNHGNWLSLQSLRRIYSKIRNYSFRLITPKLRKEFSFYNSN
jgi:hypothetical protein